MDICDLSMSELEADGFNADELENDNGDNIKQWSDLYSKCPSTEIKIYAPDDASEQAYFGQKYLIKICMKLELSISMESLSYLLMMILLLSLLKMMHRESGLLVMHIIICMI